MSHDLRAPLRAIDGFSQMLKEEKSDQLDEEGLRLLGIVRDNTALMGTLLDHLLELSRIGRRGLDITSLDMDSQVQGVVEELEGADAGRERTVTVGRLPTAYGDATLVRKVWTNLLSNAFKFSSGSHPSVVEVEGCVEGNESVYSVRDNGAGFEMRYSEKLFKVFECLHSREEFEGTGVGLAIVERVVNRLGGRVWGEGEVGVGATFWFTLPRRDQRSERPGGWETGFDGKDVAP